MLTTATRPDHVARVASTAVVECRHIARRYGHIHALSDASIRLEAGKVTALVGDNGAGKSTLVRILAGIEQPDDGEVLIDGNPVRFKSPNDVRTVGIETVYQDLSLAPTLDLAANVFLGRELKRRGPLGWLGMLNRPRMLNLTVQHLRDIGISIRSAKVPVTSLSGGQRQAIAVARATRYASRAIILDEPTAALGAAQTANVLQLTKSTAADGVAVLIISHDLPEVLEIADTVVVLRHGRTIAQLDAHSTTPSQLLNTMMGIDPAHHGVEDQAAHDR